MNRQGEGDSNDAIAAKGYAGLPAAQRRRTTPRAASIRSCTRGFLDPTAPRRTASGDASCSATPSTMRVGFDINRFIRWLNPTQTFFITTQFFYKHVFDSPGDLVLPVPFRNTPSAEPAARRQPRSPATLPARRLRAKSASAPASSGRGSSTSTTTASCTRCSSRRRTRAAGSSRSSACSTTGRARSSSSPACQFVRDPFRFIVDYTRIDGRPDRPVRRRPRPRQRPLPGRVRVLTRDDSAERVGRSRATARQPPVDSLREAPPTLCRPGAVARRRDTSRARGRP